MTPEPVEPVLSAEGGPSDAAAGAEVIIEDDRWRDIDLSRLADRALAAVMAELGLPADGFSFAVLAGSDARIAALNAEFRGKAQPTNVLSWPAAERGSGQPGVAPRLPAAGTAAEPVELGDMALAFETCEREAQAAGLPISSHVAHLIVHSLFHLLGYDHVDAADAALMERREVCALARMGVPDPYDDRWPAGAGVTLERRDGRQQRRCAAGRRQWRRG